MLENVWMNKKQRKLMSVSVILIIVFIISLSFILTKKGKDIVNTEVSNYLNEISQQTSYKVTQRIDANFSYLSTLANSLSYLDSSAYEDYLYDAYDGGAFEWIGTVDQKGMLKVKGQSLKDVSQLACVEKAMHGEAAVSDELLTIFDEKGAVYAVPYKGKDKNISAIVGWIPPKTMKLLLNTESFSGTGFSHIIARNGDYILHSQNKNALIDGNNFLNTFQQKAEITSSTSFQKFCKDIAENKKGTITFRVNGNNIRTLTYTPLDDCEWYLLSIVPSTIYSQNIENFISFALVMLAVGIAVIFFIFIIFLLYISNKKNKEISNIAYVDPITKGFTQVRFEKELKARTKPFTPYTFVSLDLRKFKLINASFGSENGNKVLQHVYVCIKKHLTDDEFVTRINADNFNIYFHTVDEATIKHRLNLIAEEINKYNGERQLPYYIPLSCGCYVVKNDDQELIVVRDKANIARKTNKDIPNYYLCNIVFYNDLEHQLMLKEKEMENMMEKALNDGEFIIYLQPKVSLKTGKIIGSEALVRWDSPEKGLIPPDDFIPFFEKNDFIIKLDMYVFEMVCKILRNWIDEGKIVHPISVNLSRNHLHHPNFLEEYRKIQRKYNVPDAYIEIELTETVVFENLEMLKTIIDEIHKYGYKCSMDDFGSGYSSLNVLKEIPVDILKLDRVFFNSENDKRGEDIVETVISLAKKLGMETIAEGIETIPQVELLKSMECDAIQGYVFSKPVPVEQFEELAQDDPEMMSV